MTRVMRITKHRQSHRVCIKPGVQGYPDQKSHTRVNCSAALERFRIVGALRSSGECTHVRNEQDGNVGPA